MACATCGGRTDGFKCAKCGAESLLNDPDHPCRDEDGNSLMTAKCGMCMKVEPECSCAGAAGTGGGDTTAAA